MSVCVPRVAGGYESGALWVCADGAAATSDSRTRERMICRYMWRSQGGVWSAESMVTRDDDTSVSNSGVVREDEQARKGRKPEPTVLAPQGRPGNVLDRRPVEPA